MNEYIYISRDKFCQFNTSLEAKDWTKCKRLDDEKTCGSYSIVYIDTHLDIKNLDCGCVVYENKYHKDFKFQEHIWNDFFKIKLSPGDHLVKAKLAKLKKE